MVILLVYVQEVQTTQDLSIQELEMKYFELYARQRGTCANFSRKSAEI